MTSEEEKDGWHPYDGSGQPVGAHTLVLVRMRDGHESHGGVSARGWRWTHTGGNSDIVAWKYAHKEDEIKPDTDPVNHPTHYTSGGIECIDVIQAQLTPEEFRGFLKGNIIKYIYRERLKGGIESLKKARWYLNKLLSVLEGSSTK